MQINRLICTASTFVLAVRLTEQWDYLEKGVTQCQRMVCLCRVFAAKTWKVSLFWVAGRARRQLCSKRALFSLCVVFAEALSIFMPTNIRTLQFNSSPNFRVPLGKHPTSTLCLCTPDVVPILWFARACAVHFLFLRSQYPFGLLPATAI